MELRTLRYFLAVAQAKTISAAAEALHVTQPTLSRQMQELEEELGKTLFLRGKRSITLTEEGTFFRKRAQEVVSLLEKTTAELKAPDELLSVAGVDPLDEETYQQALAFYASSPGPRAACGRITRM